MTEWVAVVLVEGDEPIEIPTESDGTMLLTSVTAQFPGVTGLKFRNPETGNWRGVRCHDNTLFPPDEEGWGTDTFVCTKPAGVTKKEEAALKRKSEYDTDGMSSKTQRVDDDDEMVDDNASSDLIILGLSWKATEQDIRDYFEKYGEILMIQLKKKDSGHSKGYAFIRFKDIEVQNKVLLTRHMLCDRWCDVKIPVSQEKRAVSTKIFVARLNESITESDLREHFEKFGSVTDIYIPKPFKPFAFVSFCEARVAQSLFGKDHLIKGVSVHIGSAQPKSKSGMDRGMDRGYGGNAGGRFDGGYGGFGGGGGGYPNPWNGNNQTGGGYNRTPNRGFYM